MEHGTEENQEEYLENASLWEFEIFDMLLSRERKWRHDLKSDFHIKKIAGSLKDFVLAHSPSTEDKSETRQNC